MPSGTTDAIAPQVIPPVTVIPSTAMHDAQVAVGFAVDEPLLQPPTVTYVNLSRLVGFRIAQQAAAAKRRDS